MASDGTFRFHTETDVKMNISAMDYGPLNSLPGNHFNNFRGASYYISTPRNNFIVLQRLYGGPAGPWGQYWTIEPRNGSLSYRFDYAVRENWNSLQNESKLIVPKGVYLYEGPAAPQGHYQGGGGRFLFPMMSWCHYYSINAHY